MPILTTNNNNKDKTNPKEQIRINNKDNPIFKEIQMTKANNNSLNRTVTTHKILKT
jgi:hypothetical protein